MAFSSTVYQDIKKRLTDAGIAFPEREAFQIVEYALQDKLFLLNNPLISSDQLECIEKIVQRREMREPLLYILGETEFLGCHLFIDQRVLIPRLETEELLSRVIQKISAFEVDKLTIFDVCTGSGCAGLALKKAFPSAHVYLSDISSDALDVARRNATYNQLSVHFLQGDLLEPFKDLKADVIFCNPPYISEEEYESLEIEVKKFEPKLALVGGASGDELYRRLAGQVLTHLKPGGRLVLEIGYFQGIQVKNLFNKKPFRNAEILKDLAGHDRFFYIEIE